MVELVAERGYEEVALTQILELGELDEADFQSAFANKRACFLAAEEELSARLFAEAKKAFEEPGWFPERARAALRVLTARLASRPLLTAAATVGLLRLGPEGQARYRQHVERYTELIGDARELSEFADQLPASSPLMAVGGVATLIFDEILAGRTSELEAIVPELVFALLLPFIGPEAAAEEMRITERVRGAAH
jgi:hypothetical protein